MTNPAAVERGAASWADDAHALVIGISRYLHVDPVPDAVCNGARALAAVLADPDLGGYHQEQVHTLFDLAATRPAILEALAGLAYDTTPESTVLVYFAGHGGRYDSHEGLEEAFLMPVDADDFDTKALTRTAVAGKELEAALALLPARRMVVIFDCCHAASLTAIGQQVRRRTKGSALPETFCEQLAKARRGRVIIASSRGDELSWLTDDESPGVFTRHLLTALRGAAGRDGWVRVLELFEYLQPKVTEDQPAQHPVLKAEIEESFAIARALGGRGDAPAVDLDGYRYHAYLSYADQTPDAAWVWDILIPHLQAAGLEIAVSGDVEEPGVYRVVGASRGISQARRTVIVLSEAYLQDEFAAFIDVLAQTVGLQDGVARLLPVRFGPLAADRLPARLRILVTLDLSRGQRQGRQISRLIQALRQAAPRLRD